MKDHDTVLARIAALKTTPTTKLKEQWTAPDGAPVPAMAPHVDITLVKAIARAFRW